MPRTLTLVLSGFLVTLLPMPAARAGDEPRSAFVILVGIGEYPDRAIKPRPRAEADASALYDLFTSKDHLGAPPDRVQLLLGKADARRKSTPATRANILAALKRVANQAAAEDLVVFAFFGQGAPLGKHDEHLCYLAHDSTFADRSGNAISAEDIARHLDRLQSQRLCVFLDVDFNGCTTDARPAPKAGLARFPFREFLGAPSFHDQAVVPGRVVFLANGGLKSSLEGPQHGLFAQLVREALAGAADRDGDEPDGFITTFELADHLRRELPKRAAALGKTPAEKDQQLRILSGPHSRFVLTSNPAVLPKMRAQIAGLRRLAKEDKLAPELLREGERLLGQMPLLKAQQALRKGYQALADGARTVAEFRAQREVIVQGMALDRADALTFGRKILEAANHVRERHLKEVSPGDLARRAAAGLYDAVDEPVPAALAERLAKVATMAEADLTALLADARQHLGKREDLEGHRDLDRALTRMLTSIDPRNTYLDPVAVRGFRVDSAARLTGVGFRVRKDPVTGHVVIVTPLPRSPARQAGIEAGDTITTVTRTVDSAGRPLAAPEVIFTRDLPLNELISKVLGKEGTRVKITVERQGVAKPIEFDLVRAIVETETVLGVKRGAGDTWDHWLDPKSKIACIRIAQIAGPTVRDVAAVLKRLGDDGLKGLVLDLRHNPGGAFGPTIELADLFIDDGLIVTTRSRADGQRAYQGKTEGSHLNFPLACLVNEHTSSGCEIVAGCIQDHKRGVVVGARTFGHGVIQDVKEFDGGLLRFTTALFFRPSGKNIDRLAAGGREEAEWGVVPDKGLHVLLTAAERAELAVHLEALPNILPRGGAVGNQPPFVDRQLDAAVRYLRQQQPKQR